MNRPLKWLAINGAFAGLLYLALFEGIGGAANIVSVLVWGLLPASLTLLSSEMHRILATDGRPVPAWLECSFDWAVVGLLLWHGWMLTGAAYLLHTMLCMYARDEADKLATSGGTS